MIWGRLLWQALRAISRARMRTMLTAASMAVGITALTILIGVAAGAEKAFQQALENMGKNRLSVGAERKAASALRGNSVRYRSLDLADWRALSTELDMVERAAPIAMNNATLTYRGQSEVMVVIGTSPEFQYTNNQQLLAGRFIDDYDMETLQRVTVIGSEVAKQLFFDVIPLGETLLVEGAPYTIIGVLKEKGPDLTGSAQDDRILVPISTALRRLLNVDYVDRIFVQTISKEVIPEALRQIRALLRDRHQLPDHAVDDFTVRDQASLLGIIEESDKTLTNFLGGIAALTLGLSSLGILAISLLSVNERHSEIGLKLAIGALPQHVLLQFLSESVLTSLLGGLTGLSMGTIGIMVGEIVMGWQLSFSWMSVVTTFLVSLTLALIFGAYPAFSAAKLNPIIALQSA
jgi:putative ABC transport system permease protein